MRFHLLDRITAFEPGALAVGFKTVTRTDGAAGQGPATGQTWLIESLSQLASYLLGDAERRGGREVLALLVGVEQFTFDATPQPGDRLKLVVKLATRSVYGAKVEALAETETDASVAHGRLTFAFVGAESAGQAAAFAWTADQWRVLTDRLSVGAPA